MTGVGFLLHDITASPPRLLAVAGWAFPFDLNHESRYQNASEFIAVLMGLMSLKRLGYRDVGIHLIGDNTSSESLLNGVTPNGLKESSLCALRLYT